MRIIGAGLPRTGTLTQKVALETLGVRPCYHMVDIFADLDQVALWRRAFKGEQCWGEIFTGYDATVDWPGGFYYRQLMDVYPEAKVLLSVRDPHRWEASVRSTILALQYGAGLMHHLSEARASVDPRWEDYIAMMKSMLWEDDAAFVGWDDHGGPGLGEMMERYNAEVIATVPADRLLVWGVAEGWEPLCEVLGVEVPDTPFPCVNDSATFADGSIHGSLAAISGYVGRRHGDNPGGRSPR